MISNPTTVQLPIARQTNTRLYWVLGTVVVVAVGWAIQSANSAASRAVLQINPSPIMVSHAPAQWMGDPPKPAPAPVVTPVPTFPTTTQLMTRPRPEMRMQETKPVKPAKQKQPRKSLLLIAEAENHSEKQGKNPFVLDGPTYALPSLYTVLAGTIIPAALVTPIYSSLPGGITAKVRETVYDTVSQQIVLIPQGSTILGAYDSEVNDGEARVMVVWNRLIFPDGRSKSLGQMDGIDGEGYAGLKDKVDYHFMEIFGKALVLSAIGAATNIAQNGTSGQTFYDSYNSPASQTSASLGREMGRTANNVIQRGMDRRPTITIRPGEPVNVHVKFDLVFDGEYKLQQ